VLTGKGGATREALRGQAVETYEDLAHAVDALLAEDR
jgi:hypothetical protein